MNKKNPLFTSCDHKEDCTCDNVFNELTPINPAQARQKLDCLAKYRGLLEDARWALTELTNLEPRRRYLNVLDAINEALKEESERL